MAPPALPPVPIPGTPTKVSWAAAMEAYISSIQSNTPISVVNGSFEIYTGVVANTPDNWAFTAYAGTGAIDSTDGAADGLNSFKIVVPASGGGGYLQSTLLVPWNPLVDFWASWFYYVSNATISNKVEVVWFTDQQVEISVALLWSANSGQPTSWGQGVGTVAAASIPSNAAFYALRLTGGITSNAVAGNVYFDNIKSGFRPEIQGVSTVFTSSGSFIPPTNCFRVLCKIWGGGGGNSAGSSGGAGGSYCEGFLNVFPGISVTVTVGAAGATSSVAGGSTLSAGGAGGSVSGGYLNIVGAPGYRLDAVNFGGASPQGGSGGTGAANGQIPGGGGGDGGSSVGQRGQVIIIY